MVRVVLSTIFIVDDVRECRDAAPVRADEKAEGDRIDVALRITELTFHQAGEVSAVEGCGLFD